MALAFVLTPSPNGVGKQLPNINVTTTNCLNCNAVFSLSKHIVKRITHVRIPGSNIPNLQLIAFNGSQDESNKLKQDPQVLTIQEILCYIYELQMRDLQNIIKQFQVGLCKECAEIILRIFLLERSFRNKSQLKTLLYHLLNVKKPENEINTKSTNLPKKQKQDESRPLICRQKLNISSKIVPGDNNVLSTVSNTMDYESFNVLDEFVKVEPEYEINESDITPANPSEASYDHPVVQMEEEQEEPFQPCTECGKIVHKYKMKRHMLDTHNHGTDKSNYKVNCSICGKPLVKSSLKNHMATHLGPHESILIWKCPLCPKTFDLKERYQRHVDFHTMDKAKYKKLYWGKSEPRNYKSKSVTCDICGKAIHSRTPRRTLQKHMFAVHKDKAFGYPCNICGKPFAAPSTADEHKFTHLSLVERNEMDKNFLCSSCGAAFYGIKQLQDHIRQVHAKINKIYECPICGKSFTQRRSMYRHKVTQHKNLQDAGTVAGGLEKKVKQTKALASTKLQK